MSTQPRYEIFVERLPGEAVIIHQVNRISPDPTDPAKEVRESVICQMLNLGDTRVKALLVALGWTPPATDPALVLAARKVVAAREHAGGIKPGLHNTIAELAILIK